LTAYDHLQGEGVSIRVIDAYSVQPVDVESLVTAGLKTGCKLITVEDHYPVGGLGDAVSDAVADHGITVTRLAVREIPRSGKPKELLDRYGISSLSIIAAVHRQIAAEVSIASGDS
jgi:transketolase